MVMNVARILVGYECNILFLYCNFTDWKTMLFAGWMKVHLLRQARVSSMKAWLSTEEYEPTHTLIHTETVMQELHRPIVLPLVSVVVNHIQDLLSLWGTLYNIKAAVYFHININLYCEKEEKMYIFLCLLIFCRIFFYTL